MSFNIYQSFYYLGKTTGDGLPVFNIKELNIGNGGGNFQSTLLYLKIEYKRKYLNFFLS
jgi:hypothetical protein